MLLPFKSIVGESLSDATLTGDAFSSQSAFYVARVTRTQKAIIVLK